MLRRMTVASLVWLGTFACVPSISASGHHPTLIVEPAQGHSGDVIYLSGGGFGANTAPTLEWLCTSNRVATYFHGPMTSERGSFIAFRVVAPTQTVTRPAQCKVYATRGAHGKTLTGSHPAPYTLMPAARPLVPCARHMCVTVTPALVRTSAGAQGNIAVSAWPGSVASVSIVYPGGNVKYRRVSIGWQGAGTVRVRIAKRIKGALRARVYVTATFGSMTGSTVANFIVIPNR